ncbi:hypothetical protein CDL12_08526 [Handroanthus impetiginosus]|uniref:Uncharacterized protein n=1 Tax=Handroanthus impetiginosus TaxID=429701 RepID=A0A2G9HMP3_9LAMI|nr:hypothetical protein CDL12_08526 [Handroanthus impetiginosus]
MSQGSSAPPPSQSVLTWYIFHVFQRCTREGPRKFDSSQRTAASQSSHGVQSTQKRQKKAAKDQTSRVFARSEAFGDKAESEARVESTRTSVTCTATAQSSRGVVGATTEINYDFNKAADRARKGKENQSRRNDQLLGINKYRPSSGGENSQTSLGGESVQTPRMKKVEKVFKGKGGGGNELSSCVW